MCHISNICFLYFFYRSNLVGTRFTVFNNGVNPKKGGVMSDGSNIREEVAAIIYVRIRWCYISTTILFKFVIIKLMQTVFCLVVTVCRLLVVSLYLSTIIYIFFKFTGYKCSWVQRTSENDCYSSGNGA